MNQRTTIWTAALSTLLLAVPTRSQEQDAPPEPLRKDLLAEPLTRAKVHNKRIAVLFGKDAGADEELALVIRRNRNLARMIRYEYVDLRVRSATEAKLAERLGLADHLEDRIAMAILDADGKVLARNGWADLSREDELDDKRLLAALEPHKCAPLDARAKLKSALAEASKTGRNVFVRFDAPW
jgi:hypothetical protein